MILVFRRIHVLFAIQPGRRSRAAAKPSADRTTFIYTISYILMLIADISDYLHTVQLLDGFAVQIGVLL